MGSPYRSDVLEGLISKWADIAGGGGNKKWSPGMTRRFCVLGTMFLFYECPFYLINRSQ